VRILLTVLLLLWVHQLSAHGATLHVPGEFPTLQAAVDAAENGDLILVDAGEYEEEVLVSSKEVHFVSLRGRCETHISACSAAKINADCYLDVFIDRCAVADGGLMLSAPFCQVTSCQFENGSLLVHQCWSAFIAQNVVRSGDLEVHVGPSGGGGAAVLANAVSFGGIPLKGWAGAGTNVCLNTVHGSAGDGIRIEGELDLDPLELSSNIVACCERGVVWANSSLSVERRCNDVWGNAGGNWIGISDPTGEGGNISLDPMFCDPAAGDLTLASESPCLPGNPGNGDCGQIGALGLGCELPAEMPESERPGGLFLARPAPNPSSAGVVLRYGIPAGSRSTRVRLDILDAGGRIVRTLVRGAEEAGTSRVWWNGTDDRGVDVPSGVYWSRLLVGRSTEGEGVGQASERIVRVR